MKAVGSVQLANVGLSQVCLSHIDFGAGGLVVEKPFIPTSGAPIQMEDGTGYILLEDGSGYLLIE